MSVVSNDLRSAWPSVVAAVCLAGGLVLFLAAALADGAYASSYEIQWNNFASWLLVGALIMSAIALGLSLINLRFPHRRTRPHLLYSFSLAIGWLIGLFNAFTHARDAWGSMPAGLWLSVVSTLALALATWLFYFSLPAEQAR
jgi:uncharacterized membrane protein